jgi:hypothetical protein
MTDERDDEIDGPEAAAAPSSADDLRDELPDDLDAAGYVGPYKFPDNSRRRIPGVIYTVVGAALVVIWAVRGDGTYVNGGLLFGGILLLAWGLFCITSGWRMRVDEKAALAAAGEAVGFAIGHASAQQVWRGLRSRPTWRVLCYSAEDPPLHRGLVLVDAVDGRVLEHLVQDSPPTDWED